MRLLEARKLFFELRSASRIEVCEEHVIGDHPERGYSIEEVVNLVSSSGKFENTNNEQYLGRRFYWRTKDVLGKKVRLVIEFEEDENGQLILVISAGERVD